MLIFGTFFTLIALSTSKNILPAQNQDNQEAKCLELHLNTSSLGSEFSTFSNSKCLNLKNNGLVNISNSLFQSFLNLQQLNLASNSLETRNLKFASNIPQLKTLILDKAYKSYDAGKNAFHLDLNSPTLKSLFLRFNNIDQLIISDHLHLDTLKDLILSNNQISQINLDKNGPKINLDKNGPKINLAKNDPKINLDKNGPKINFNWLPESLENLYIENNNLEELTLINKPHLLKVYARNNNFRTLRLENLPNLQQLLLNKDSINEVSIKNLNNIQNLLLGFDELQRLDSSHMNGLQSLEYLQLSCQNLLFFDGKIVDQMPSLNTLFLGPSLLNALPRIQNATNLQYLFLPKNRLENLNPEDFQGMPNLEELDLSENLLMELKPKTFGGMPNLQILNLEENLIKSVSYSDFEPLHSLKKLRLSKNRISSFNGRIVDQNPFLNELYLGNNFLEEVPKIRRAENLRVLDLGGNKIVELYGTEFSKFPKLQRLVLSFNNLRKIDAETFKGLVDLRNLNLDSNRLETLPDNWSSNLKFLETVTLQENEFQNYEALSLNENQFQNVALAYSFNNDCSLYCTLRDGENLYCKFLNALKVDTKVFCKKMYMTFRKAKNGKFKLIPSAEM